jgi:tetratricopeptide (TPR) repeat protein
MPLSTTYTWRQNATSVTIEITLHSGEIDVYLSPCYVKVSEPPYLLSLDLFSRVEDASARVTHDRTQKRLVLELPKQAENGSVLTNWSQLTCDLTDKAAITTRRAASIAERAERDAQKAKALVDIKGEQMRGSVRAQMDVEDKQRRHLEGIQLEQKTQAQEEVFAALAALSSTPSEEKNAASRKAQIELKTSSEGSSSTVSASSKKETSLPLTASSETPSMSQPTPPDFKSAVTTPAPAVTASTGGKTKLARNGALSVSSPSDDVITPLPPPRSAGRSGVSSKIGVQFTSRAFPTPLRESRKKEEEDWLARNYLKLAQNQAQKKLAAGGDPTAPFQERDATWLKSKGDDFYRNADFGSAINAYTAALNAEPSSLPCLLNRAACYLGKHMPKECIADCTAALSLLPSCGAPGEPVSEAVRSASQVQRSQLLRVLARRIAAQSMEGKFSAALADARVGASIDSSLETSVETLTILSRAQSAKEEGDAASTSNNTDLALAQYSHSLEISPHYVLALVNRSALYMRLEKYIECKMDCERVMELMYKKGNTKGETKEEEEDDDDDDEEDNDSSIPVNGSPLFSQVMTRVTARLAECNKHLGVETAVV